MAMDIQTLIRHGLQPKGQMHSSMNQANGPMQIVTDMVTMKMASIGMSVQMLQGPRLALKPAETDGDVKIQTETVSPMKMHFGLRVFGIPSE